MLIKYIGTCFVCFDYIEEGKEYQIRKGGRLFHEQCVKKNPYDSYVLLEQKCAKEDRSD
ncbi:hypothetical protein [Dethiobacter alkaliphilus]|uniref:Uncharacterized protein n=1 Tax=Dethiobacter alkaliphilus AHT 1 TaxID=555088 RepID=C0GKU1_DETAL|nr:hypothetical protein [Dethiobacter alkaliphilus]EEG76060.1 hypothetical protein DealDRAFT_3100 [Dethiobacter alkaliphilus AHT 1]